MLWSLLSSPAARYLVLGLIVATAAGGAYLAIDHRAYSRCERDRDLVDLQAAQAAHQIYLQEVERGDQISAELAKTQRRLNATKSEYLAYANSIVGNCPAGLGVLLGPEGATGALPQAAGPSADPAATVAAAIVATNIAENRGRFEANFAQCAALIEWHSEKDVK